MAVRQRPSRAAPGQHFLRSSRLAAEIVREAGVAPGDLIVDVGAGTGVLTQALADAGGRVLALELDPVLAAGLRRRFAGRDVDVLAVDAREWSWPEAGFAVVANLPFAGSRSILGDLLGDPRIPVRRVDAVVQWEAAVKQTAVWPATLQSTCWSAWHELAVTVRIARSAFSPPPGVDAGVFRAVRRPHPLVAPTDHADFRRFVTDGFRARAPLRVALRTHLSARELKRLGPVLGFAPDALPRDLGPGQWAGLFAFARTRERVR